MSTTVPPVITAQPSHSFGAGRVLLLVFGSIALLIALALFAGGGAAVWGLSQRDGSGYITSGSHQLATPSYALVSDSLDVGTDAPGWVFGDHFANVRIQATSSQPIFIGIARTTAVERYFAGVQHDQIRDFEVDPFTASYRHVAGSAAPGPPAAQSFWRAKASGPGTQTITWPLEKGNWSVVAMNASASRGVTIDTRLGARLPYLRWVAIGFLVGGGVVLILGASLIYLGARRPRAATREV
jgi:hypothetical protein